jgi:hypothetical protein
MKRRNGIRTIAPPIPNNPEIIPEMVPPSNRMRISIFPLK